MRNRKYTPFAPIGETLESIRRSDEHLSDLRDATRRHVGHAALNAQAKPFRAPNFDQQTGRIPNDGRGKLPDIEARQIAAFERIRTEENQDISNRVTVLPPSELPAPRSVEISVDGLAAS